MTENKRKFKMKFGGSESGIRNMLFRTYIQMLV